MKTFILSLPFGLIPPAIAWVGGLEFERGPDAAFTLALSLIFVAAAYTFPRV